MKRKSQKNISAVRDNYVEIELGNIKI